MATSKKICQLDGCSKELVGRQKKFCSADHAQQSRTKEQRPGRPTILTVDLLKQAKKYLDGCKDSIEQYVRQENPEKGYIMYGERLVARLPNIAGFARYLGISRVTVYDWAEKNKEFSYIVEDILAEQEQRLLLNGITGTYNSSISKLLLSKHGYADRSELTGKDGGPIEVEGNQITVAAYGTKSKRKSGG